MNLSLMIAWSFESRPLMTIPHKSKSTCYCFFIYGHRFSVHKYSTWRIYMHVYINTCFVGLHRWRICMDGDLGDNSWGTVSSKIWGEGPPMLTSSQYFENCYCMSDKERSLTKKVIRNFGWKNRNFGLSKVILKIWFEQFLETLVIWFFGPSKPSAKSPPMRLCHILGLHRAYTLMCTAI